MESKQDEKTTLLDFGGISDFIILGLSGYICFIILSGSNILKARSDIALDIIVNSKISC